jgi:hypothetical protein
MYLFYNGLWFDANEAEIVISRKRAYNQQYRLQVETHTWNVSGVRQAANQSALTTSINTFESYMTDGGDIGLYLDDQSTLTSHYLVSSESLGGTRITDLSYPKGAGAEYSTYRSWAFTLEAAFAPIGFGGNLLEFEETLTFEGDGGPRTVWLETAVGLPVEQQVSQFTTYKATQSGSAVQLGSPPLVPPPIWPDMEIRPARRLPKATKSGGSLQYTSQWSYSFESAFPLFAEPHYIY